MTRIMGLSVNLNCGRTKFAVPTTLKKKTNSNLIGKTYQIKTDE